MAGLYLVALLLRLVLPAGLLLSMAIRPFGLSVVYLLLYLIAPLFQVPNARTFKGAVGKFLIITIVISNALLLIHAVWHSVLAGFPPYGSILHDYPLIEKIGYNLGLVSYATINPLMAVHYLAPEAVMSITSIAVYTGLKKIFSNLDDDQITDTKHQQFPRLTSAGKYFCLMLIMFAGIMRPSVTSGIYFLVFMGAATAWSLGQPLERGFAVVGRCLMAVMAAHVLVLIAYQNSWAVDFYPPDNDLARYFGLTKLVNLNETVPNDFTFDVTDNYKWATLISPLCILVTYFVLALETRELFKPKLMQGSSSRRWPSRSGIRRLQQDSTGSVIVGDPESSLTPEEPTLLDDIIVAFVDFFRVLVRSSYIATTITMMAWSILFHSWLTFVFLMWANIVWLCQDQRSFMLKTSPVLVIYAMFLLISQYVYGMDLTESELPSNITEVNLQQIGLRREEGEPCVSLLIKSLFACMFWVTLRLHVQELRERRRAGSARELAGPLQLTVSTAASVIGESHEEIKRSRLLGILGDFLKAACARYWIYVVVVMLFVIGITGKRMTIFRIVYMFLFLGFILMFQLSWYWWRRLMYVFWITLIIYSMINLILVYTYQFDDASDIISQYLGIDKQLQHDLGLEPFAKADLFIKLLTPTCFLIITIMQVHYFHKDFMELSDPQKKSTLTGNGSSKPSQAGASTTKDDVPPLPSQEERPVSRNESITEADNSLELSTFNTRQDLQRKPSRSRSYQPTATEPPSTALRAWILDKLINIKSYLTICIDTIFMYLHLHLLKIIFFALTLLSVGNVCAAHVPIMWLVAPGLLLNSSKQRCIVHFISILISVYLMLQMVYQIEYIRHSYFDVNCTMSSDGNDSAVNTYNNAEWMGLEKAVVVTLPQLLKGYISLIALFTFHSLVSYRQLAAGRRNLATTDEEVLFPEVTRKEADKNLIYCTKYIINYGFYKFGVEITLICLIGVIGSRMDVYAVFYAFWLLLFVGVKRQTQAKMWLPFTMCVTILVPLQYMIAVGFVPQLCINYPWTGDGEFHKHLRTWFFLPYAQEPPHATKLVFDFVLVLFAARQLLVFRIERKHGDTYPGGTNTEDIGQDWETPNFVNPVPDFLGVINSWLDVVKRIVFLGLLWITLAIMFLTGTNRVNLFSMGYLIGSFIFLWQGTDFYLRPKKEILKWWSWLLCYNVTVIVFKALLQIPGCLYGQDMRTHACWLVQLLGIGCVDKFAGGNIARFLKMNPQNVEACSVPQEDIGLAWDGVCFAFLILQRRLFHSYYFYRVIDESKATTVLASRGAELIEELRQKQMNLQEDQEVRILEKIKVKMERIKANQKKIQGAITKDAPHHDRAPVRPYKEPTSHQKAVRSGDYYMFDEFDDTEVPLRDDDSSSDEDAPKEMGLGKKEPKISDPSRGVPSADDRDGTSELDDLSRAPGEETKLDKVLQLCISYWWTAWAFICSALVTATKALMKFSRDYRYVSRALSLEKKKLKDQEGFGIGLREGSQMIWEPLPETLAHPKDLTILEEQEDSMFNENRSPFVHLLYALWYTVVAHTDIVCYIMVFINQIQSATILSIPLPMMVFLWGTLTIPRPTKTFWVTLIAYTEVIVLIKSMFQFEILPWNQAVVPENMPFTAPRIIGIERKSNYALYDLLLLLIIFLHRFMLKSLGLWKESCPEVDLRKDMNFALTNEDTRMIIEGFEGDVGKKYVRLHDTTGPNQESVNVEAVDRSDSPGDPETTKEHTDPEAGPSKDPHDEHHNVTNEEEPIIAVTTTLDQKYGNFGKVILLSVRRYLRPTERFFRRMLAPGARVTGDVYAYMFLCDFFNFLVVIFGFAAFGTQQGDGGVQAYLEENKVPIPFLVMLILQFALIVIDRALYLRKFMLGKILFQYALIIGVHIWMFFLLPSITERKFNARLPPPIWYMVKCLYLLLSAHQIRCGYPRRIIGNFLCKSYRFLNMIFFRAFMAVPFVFELRTLMDWIWTDTSMTLMDWLKMEDIFASVFLLKCSRYIEDEYPQPRGLKKTNMSKYLLGGSVLAFVIAIIWFPLVFFAFGNSVGEPNPPTDVTVKIRIGPFLPVYQMSAQSHNIAVFQEQDYTHLSNQYSRDRTAQTFLSNYMFNDVAVVVINPNSTMKWEISPPELERLEREAVSNASLTVKFSFVITRPSNNAQNPPTIDDSREVPLPAYIDEKRNPERDKLLRLLAGNATSETWLNVPVLFPKFLKVFNKGTAKPAYQLIPETVTTDMTARLYRDVQLRLERHAATGAMYWRVREACNESDSMLLRIPKNDCDMLVMYTFNDKLFPETLNFISGGGIIGLYTTFVFLASRVLRGFFSGIYTKIMFDDLPNVDRVLQLCLDIYLVREALELALEEDLFAKLVFLYRSPETMIKWSRPKDEDADEQRALPPLE